MTRTVAEALVLVNWKGVFYERYLIDPCVTALEGANGAGKTTVMIAAYVVLLPDMTRLRFTNLGETGNTGGDKGIWGRLGEPGRPSYSAIDFTTTADQRIIAGVHLERKNEPSVELTPFIISGLNTDIRLQNIFLLTQGDNEAVPELNELRENTTRFGGYMQTFSTAREYFIALFDYGVTPMRLATDEERNKLNEMLHTSMMGGISRTLSSGLRSFLLKEEAGLADTLQRMRTNLDACKRTRTEVQEAQRLYQEISGVFEAGQAMFTAAFFATQAKTKKMEQQLTEADEAYHKAKEKLSEIDKQLARVCNDIDKKEKQHESLAHTIKANDEQCRRLQQALDAANDVAARQKEMASAETEARSTAEHRNRLEKEKNQYHTELGKRREEYNAAASGLADFQKGLEELNRRANAYKQVIRRKSEAERLLNIGSVSGEYLVKIAPDIRAKLDIVDRSRRDVKRNLTDIDARRREYATTLAALETIANEIVEPNTAYTTAVQQIRRLHNIEVLASRLKTIASDLTEAKHLAKQQAEAHELTKLLNIQLSGCKPAPDEITELLNAAEQEREKLSNLARTEQTKLDECRRKQETLLLQRKELSKLEPLWHDLAISAKHLTDDKELACLLTSIEEIQDAHSIAGQQLTKAKIHESKCLQQQDDLKNASHKLLTTGGAFDPELIRLKDHLGADLLASVFEDAPPDDAAVLEAKLGPLVHALIVDDPTAAARQVVGRPESLPDVWFVGRNEDMTWLDTDTYNQSLESGDIIARERLATRVTRIPSHPHLGRKAREQRAAELLAKAKKMGTEIEHARTNRLYIERLVQDASKLLKNHAVWLNGNPSHIIDSIQQQLSDISQQQENHTAEITNLQALSPRLTLHIDNLRKLLGFAALLDQPDYTQRSTALECGYTDAKAATAEISRCQAEAAVVENNLEVLRHPPLSEDEAGAFRSELSRLSDERDKLDASIEAIEYVSVNLEALKWGDAKEKLDEKRPLEPDLHDQMERAKDALMHAEVAERSAAEMLDKAVATHQTAAAEHKAATSQFEAANRRFMDIGIENPTQDALDNTKINTQRLTEEHKAVGTELEGLRKRQGRLEAEHDQAETNRQSTEQAASEKHLQAVPVFEYWKHLSSRVADLKLFAATNHADSSADNGEDHLKFEQTARSQKAILIERLRAAHGTHDILSMASGGTTTNGDPTSADEYLNIWLTTRDWLNLRLPAQIADVSDPQEALARLNGQLIGLEERLVRQEEDLRGASEDVARSIDVQIRRARGQVSRLNKSLEKVSFGTIDGLRVKIQPETHMEQILLALREGGTHVQETLFSGNIPIEEALNSIFSRYGGGRAGAQRLLDYREYINLQVEIRRGCSGVWEQANSNRLSTGEAIGVGAALMMVVLTEWEQDANLLRGKRSHGSLRFLFLDEANRLSQDNLDVLFDLCQALELQLLIAAPEVARAGGNTTYHLARHVNHNGHEEVLVSGRRMIINA